jgi:hypothetical protein
MEHEMTDNPAHGEHPVSNGTTSAYTVSDRPQPDIEDRTQLPTEPIPVLADQLAVSADDGAGKA